MQVETATGEVRSGELSFGSVSDFRNESRKVSQVQDLSKKILCSGLKLPFRFKILHPAHKRVPRVLG